MSGARSYYSVEDKSTALQMRMSGEPYLRINSMTGIPVETLSKWFAPSSNRHGLADIKARTEKACSDRAKALIASSIDAVVAKLVDRALAGDLRAQVEVINRVFGRPREEREKKEEDEKVDKLVIEHIEKGTNYCRNCCETYDPR